MTVKEYWGTITDPDGKVRNRMDEREQYLDDIKTELAYINNLVPGRILDIGCGPGWLLSALPGAWEKFGIEPDRVTTEITEESGIIVADTLLGADYRGKPFDVIVMHHVIEHMEDPEAAIKEVFRILKPGGKLLIGTPDFDSPVARRFGDNYRMLYDKTHISPFTHQSMHTFLTGHGFVIDEVKYPFFEGRHFTKENLLRLLDTDKVSPPFFGNWMTFYCHKPETTDGWVEKPWGGWKTLEKGEGWQVKMLRLTPGSAMSLQRHQRRSERWVALEGEGLATKGETDMVMRARDYLFVAAGTAHRIRNAGDSDLLILETQFGDYFGEDDLERLDDQYGRRLGKVDPADD